MSFQQRNISVTMGSFSFILGYYLLRVFQLIQRGEFIAANLFKLWGIVAGMAVFVTIAAIILAHIGSGIVEAIKTREEPTIEDTTDERDQLIDLKGTRVTHLVSSFGALIAMLSFVLGWPALVMFALLIFFGLSAQIAGDLARAEYYRKGF